LTGFLKRKARRSGGLFVFRVEFRVQGLILYLFIIL
jgi:hypothetical protein